MQNSVQSRSAWIASHDRTERNMRARTQHTSWRDGEGGRRASAWAAAPGGSTLQDEAPWPGSRLPAPRTSPASAAAASSPAPASAPSSSAAGQAGTRRSRGRRAPASGASSAPWPSPSRGGCGGRRSEMALPMQRWEARCAACGRGGRASPGRESRVWNLKWLQS
jgi:hypothetical protein